MPARELKCPRCGESVHIYRNPIPTVDVIIEVGDKVVLISRKNPPYGWAIPGGFVDYGESLEEAAVREAREETGLEVKLLEQFYTYSDPERDPRHHTITTVYVAKAERVPKGLDDAREAGLFSDGGLPEPLVFDHGQILKDYFEYKRTGRKPQPRTSHSPK
ncbi:MAG TPA: NUDIX hydrolase [Candidatus Latescibacteria bacterium]|nr:NUDIX hydrolase [Candidatus Latescibacterota bacterium]